MSEKPKPTFKEKVNAVLFLVAAAWVGWLFFGPDGDEPTEPVQEVSDADCLQDIHCWGERHFVAASVRCPDAIERLARYTMEWTDGILEPKFSHYRFSPLGDGIVVYVGDTARFQNGFGAWQNMVYECTFDPATEQVLDATAQPGRL